MSRSRSQCLLPTVVCNTSLYPLADGDKLYTLVPELWVACCVACCGVAVPALHVPDVCGMHGVNFSTSYRVHDPVKSAERPLHATKAATLTARNSVLGPLLYTGSADDARTGGFTCLKQSVFTAVIASTLLVAPLPGAYPAAAAVPASSVAGQNVGFLKGQSKQRNPVARPLVALSA